MNRLLRALDRLRWPRQADAEAVRRMTVRQWAGIAKRTGTYLEGYRDRPGVDDRAQRRAEWLASFALWWAHHWSVLEVGCGAGRNLAVLGRRWPHLALAGIDICPEGIAEARRTVPKADLACLDLYEIAAWPAHWRADVMLTVGVLSHLQPTSVAAAVRALARRAGIALLFVEHFAPGGGRLLKGPASWRPTLKATGPYMLWTVSVEQVMERGGFGDGKLVALPEDLQSPGATAALWVDRR